MATFVRVCFYCHCHEHEPDRTLAEGHVLGIDLNPIAPTGGGRDDRGGTFPARVRDTFGVVSVVVADASPKLSGQRSYDQALAFARAVLKTGGTLVEKLFLPRVFWGVRTKFRSARTYHAKASRKGPREIDIIGKNIIGCDADADRPVGLDCLDHPDRPDPALQPTEGG